VKNIYNGLSATHTITQEHLHLLDVLAMLACRVAITITDEPHGHIPQDLEDIMRAVQHHDIVDLSNPLYQSFSGTVRACAPALIFVARYEPDLFPNHFARAMVYQLAPLELWNIACGVDGINVEGISVAHIPGADSGQHSLWESLNFSNSWGGRAPIEVLIAPPVFSRILNAYEKQVEQEGPANMQL
jgi:hypothetical protein